ncbi:HEXXH motif domain-containing protein [Actinoplanes subglobosus]|uniref:HEXXH motif domain-containing protein n=1 Tax=Actinoplanes subglobosus TaxID=1547892 RepID=A0ABV8IRX4_9ACTN
MTIRWHDLSPIQFAGLAGGYGGDRAVAALTRAQLSKHLLLIKFIADTWSGDRAHRDAALAVLVRAQRADQDRFAEVLTEPLVGAWTAVTTRRLRGVTRSGVPLDVDCNHLSAVAAAVAARAGLDADLTVHVSGGGVTLPGLGRALTGIPDHTPVTVRVRDGRATVGGQTGWQPLRQLTAVAAGRELRVGLDDLDPYRGGHHAPPTDRLDPGEVQRWQDGFAAGWQLIADHDPVRAGELSAGLRTLVPLARLDAHSARSATIRDAFGAFGLTRPGNPADFAVMLIHEFQHSKLSGVLDIQPLTDPADTGLHFAPWRIDPRPVGGLIQGVYAFLGIAQFWLRLLDVPELTETAEEEFALSREQVRWGLRSLEASAALLPAGQRFTAGMRSAFEALAGRGLPTAVVRRAEEALHGAHTVWQQRHAGALRG